MLTEYVEAAMAKARYEILQDEKIYYGQIPGFQGVWAQGHTLEICRRELQETLEEWLLIKLRKNQRIPHVRGISLSVKKVA